MYCFQQQQPSSCGASPLPPVARESPVLQLYGELGAHACRSVGDSSPKSTPIISGQVLLQPASASPSGREHPSHPSSPASSFAYASLPSFSLPQNSLQGLEPKPPTDSGLGQEYSTSSVLLVRDSDSGMSQIPNSSPSLVLVARETLSFDGGQSHSHARSSMSSSSPSPMPPNNLTQSQIPQGLNSSQSPGLQHHSHLDENQSSLLSSQPSVLSTQPSLHATQSPKLSTQSPLLTAVTTLSSTQPPYSSTPGSPLMPLRFPLDVPQESAANHSPVSFAVSQSTSVSTNTMNQSTSDTDPHSVDAQATLPLASSLSPNAAGPITDDDQTSSSVAMILKDYPPTFDKGGVLPSMSTHAFASCHSFLNSGNNEVEFSNCYDYGRNGISYKAVVPGNTQIYYQTDPTAVNYDGAEDLYSPRDAYPASHSCYYDQFDGPGPAAGVTNPAYQGYQHYGYDQTTATFTQSR
ncbi:hypothetical protein FHG87_019436 [Trinorchestia longiramus]|nr:hypothetical protein FHG87_019436 [Trinorchestia longiramus]